LEYTEFKNLAQKARLWPEFYYRQDENLFAEFMDINYADKKILFCDNSQHTKKILDNIKNRDLIAGVIKRSDNNVDFSEYNLISPADIKLLDIDYIAVVGYWRAESIEELKKELSFENIINPYNSKFMQSFISDVKTEIDKVKLSQDKPNLVLILEHDGRDFFTKSSKELSKDFNLIKIYVGDFSINEKNNYFHDVITLKNSILFLEYFFDIHSPEYVAIFVHGVDTWKVPYIKSLVPNSTKIVTGTCDISYNFFPRKDEIIKLNQNSEDRFNLGKYGENFFIDHSDGIVCNFVGMARDEMSSRNKNYLYSPYTIESDLFDYEDNEIDFDNIRLAYAGSISSNYHILFNRISYQYNVFKKLLDQGMYIDAYSFYDFYDSSLGIYKDLMNDYKELFYLKNFLPHNELIKKTKNFDFGLLIYECDHEIVAEYKVATSSTVQGKLISSLAAGLPVLVSTEFGAISDFTLEHGVGISIDFDDIVNTKEIIKSYDYNELKENVKKFQKNYIDYNYPKEITDFIKSI
jgi:hypothetical protein